MMCFILWESLPQPLESCEWDGDDVCSCMVKYVCVRSLYLDSGLRYVDTFVWVAFFEGIVWGIYRGSDESLIFGLGATDTWVIRVIKVYLIYDLYFVYVAEEFVKLNSKA